MYDPYRVEPPAPFDFWDPDNWPTQYSEKMACPARIYHGNRHQIYTTCQLVGSHEIHQANYGDLHLLARWTGEQSYSGPYDEPPTKPEEEQ